MPDVTVHMQGLLMREPMPPIIRQVAEKLDQAYVDATAHSTNYQPTTDQLSLMYNYRSLLARVIFYYGGMLPYLQSDSGLVTTWTRAQSLWMVRCYRVPSKGRRVFLNSHQNANATTEQGRQLLLRTPFLRPLHVDGVNYIYPIGLVNDICTFLKWVFESCTQPNGQDEPL